MVTERRNNMATEFSQLAMNKERSDTNVLVVDGLNLAFRWKYSKAKQFSSAYIDTINSLAKSYACGRIIVLSDFGHSEYRKNIHPEYKGNRIALKEKQTEQEAKEFAEFFIEFENTLNIMELEGFEVYKYKNVEADDIAAFIVSKKELLGFENITLVSSDKDWDLLIANNISRFCYITRKTVTVDNWHHPVDRDKYLTFKCLTGDTGDNIPGIPNIGPKRAASLIEQYGNVMEIYDSLPIQGKYKYIESLNSLKERLLLNVELMDLVTFCEDAIGEENCKDILERLQGAI